MTRGSARAAPVGLLFLGILWYRMSDSATARAHGLARRDAAMQARWCNADSGNVRYVSSTAASAHWHDPGDEPQPGSAQRAAAASSASLLPLSCDFADCTPGDRPSRGFASGRFIFALRMGMASSSTIFIRPGCARRRREARQADHPSGRIRKSVTHTRPVYDHCPFHHGMGTTAGVMRDLRSPSPDRFVRIVASRLHPNHGPHLHHDRTRIMPARNRRRSPNRWSRCHVTDTGRPGPPARSPAGS